MQKLLSNSAQPIVSITWTVALLLSAFLSFIAGYVGSGFSHPSTSVPFLLLFPSVLLAIASFRLSTVSVTAILVWEALSASWPHITLSDICSGLDDEKLLLATAILSCIPALVAQDRSLVRLYQSTRDEE